MPVSLGGTIEDSPAAPVVPLEASSFMSPALEKELPKIWSVVVFGSKRTSTNDTDCIYTACIFIFVLIDDVERLL